MMNDFTIQVSGMPNNIEYDNSEEILRAMLWDHF